MKKYSFFAIVLSSPSAMFFSFFFFLFSFSTVHAQIINTIAGNGISGYSGYGIPATAAEIGPSWGIGIDKSGNLYIADRFNVRVRKVDVYGIITTIAGNGTSGYSGDGGPATMAELGAPNGVFVDDTGNVYITDGSSVVRKVNTVGIITTIAGNYTLGAGYSGDGGQATAAQLWSPTSAVMDGAGNMYIADFENARIRKVNTAGIITTIAGNGTYAFYGDGGPATAAELHDPNDIAVDGAGSIYISDGLNHRIRKINASGIITTIAGTGTGGYTGDGITATASELFEPNGVAVDATGNVYIGDLSNSRVREVNTSGIISTIVGTGADGYIGDGMPATATELSEARQIRVDCGGNLYIADVDNNRIRKVTYDHAPYFTGGHTEYLAVCENAPATAINTLLSAIDIDTLQTATWSVALPPAHGAATVLYTTSTTRGMLTPTGSSYTPATGYSGYDSFKVVVEDCGFMTDTTTIYVTINPLPGPPAIKGAGGLCVGTPITVTDDTTGGVWSSAAGAASIGSVSGVVTGLSAGTATVSYTVTNACGDSTVTRTLEVDNALPNAGTVTGTDSVCAGNTVTLTDLTGVAGGLWSSSNTAASVAAGMVTGKEAGRDTISYAASNYCGTAKATLAVKVLPYENCPAAVASPPFGNSSGQAVTVYPNPNNGEFMVKVPGSGKFTVYSMMGQKVQEYNVIMGETELQLPANLAAGVYMGQYKPEDGGGVVNVKMMAQ